MVEMDLDINEKLKIPPDTTHKEELIHIKDPGGNIEGILTVPARFASVLPGCQVVVIAHGFGENKNSAYQEQLAARLTRSELLLTFRFDFRPASLDAKSILHDWDAVMKYLTVDRRFTIAGIVSHSVANATMFEWLGQTDMKIPSVVNCAGPFMTPNTQYEHFYKQDPDAEQKGYFEVTLPETDGLTKVPFQLIDSLNKLDTADSIARMDDSTHVLTVYATNDAWVQLDAADQYAASLQNRNTLRIVSGADHRLFVDGNCDRTVDIIGTWLSDEQVRERFMLEHKFLGVPRWKCVEGVSNFRDIGGYPTTDGRIVRGGLLYRAANPATATPAGIRELHRLGIKTIIDFRSDVEIAKVASANFEGIETLSLSVYDREDWTPDNFKTQNEKFKDPIEGFLWGNQNMLNKAGRAYGTVVRRILANPQSPLIYHCTAGKDRTGLFTSLLLLVCNVDYDTVCREYDLSMIGVASEMPKLVALSGGLDQLRAKLGDLTGMFNMAGVRYMYCMNMIEYINDKYGSAAKWFEQNAGLNSEEIQQLREVLTAS